mmetsp:Transcript_5664/g.13165  ORF Transcript_5664/g.13165 Transcript_5664/m.13165 type:complete len:321 (+) Transcript_5664:147-1109(+)
MCCTNGRMSIELVCAHLSHCCLSSSECGKTSSNPPRFSFPSSSSSSSFLCPASPGLFRKHTFSLAILDDPAGGVEEALLNVRRRGARGGLSDETDGVPPSSPPCVRVRADKLVCLDLDDRSLFITLPLLLRGFFASPASACARAPPAGLWRVNQGPLDFPVELKEESRAPASAAGLLDGTLLSSCFLFLGSSGSLGAGAKPSRSMVSLMSASLTSTSSCVSVASAGDELTSMSQGCSSLSTITSNPNSSKPAACRGILGHRASIVRMMMCLIRSNSTESSTPAPLRYFLSLVSVHLQPDPTVSLCSSREGENLLMEELVR